MGNIIANNLATFSGNIQSYESACTALERDYDRVISLMKSMNDMWTGQAHDTLMERFMKDQQSARDVVDYVKDILKDLKYAAEEYKKCENQVRGIIESIQA